MACVCGQVLLTADDMVRRGHYTNARRTLERLLGDGRGAGGQRERHRGHPRDPVRGQRPARRPGRAPGAGRRCWCCSPTSTRSTTGRRPARSAKRIPLVRGPADLDRRPARGGRCAGLGTGGMVTKVDAAQIATAAGIPTVLTSAELAGRALAGQDVGTCFQAGPGAGHQPDAVARARRPLRAAGWCSTTARWPRWCSAARRCCRPGSPRSRAASPPATPSTWSAPDGVPVRPGAGQLRRRRAARPARPLHPRPGSRAGCRLRARGRPPRRPGAAVTVLG